MTPEEKLIELRKIHWSKCEWLENDKARKNYPNSVAVKERERDVLAAVIKDYEKWAAKRANDGKAQ